MQGGLRLKVRVWDEDSGTRHDLVDNLSIKWPLAISSSQQQSGTLLTLQSRTKYIDVIM